jgi:hypothetical protein
MLSSEALESMASDANGHAVRWHGQETVPQRAPQPQSALVCSCPPRLFRLGAMLSGLSRKHAGVGGCMLSSEALESMAPQS